MVKFKAGDKVRLVNMEDSKFEFNNWITEENKYRLRMGQPPIKIGDEFEFSAYCSEYHVVVKGIMCMQVAERFEKI